MEEWEDKLMELEREGIWETVTKEKLPVDDDDKTIAFVFKLLWKILAIELYNVSKRKLTGFYVLDTHCYFQWL